ncbi:MAG: hypothetical protein AB1758_33075 [Candidatus Eremiobacterota bacterium]
MNLLNRLLEADASLRTFHRALDAAFERLSARDPDFLARLPELAREARSLAGPDPTAEVHAVLDQVADAVDTMRQELFEHFEACPDVERVHLGYIGRAAALLDETGDPVWLRRGLAVAALGRGGQDVRDLHLSLQDLVRAGVRHGLAVRAELRRMAETTRGYPGQGGIRGSIGDFLGEFPVPQ